MFVVEVVVGVIVVVALGLLLAAVGGGLPAAAPDTDDPGVPTDRLLASTDVPRLRFRRTLLGYRMADVDAAMSAVHAALWAAEQKSAAPGEPAEPGAAGEEAGE